MIEALITIKSEQSKDPAPGQSGPTAKEQKVALKAEWAPALLRAAEHKLRSDKIGDREEAICAIDKVIGNLGASQHDMSEKNALAAIMERTLKHQSDSPFLNALSLARCHTIAQTAIKQADPIPLADKLLVAFRKGNGWEKAQTTHAIRLLDHSGKSHFINGLLEQPKDFQRAGACEKNDIVYVLIQLLSANESEAQKTVTAFMKAFSKDLNKDLSRQVRFLENGNAKLDTDYLNNLKNLFELSQD